jgi:hypothetical protein
MTSSHQFETPSLQASTSRCALLYDSLFLSYCILLPDRHPSNSIMWFHWSIRYPERQLSTAPSTSQFLKSGAFQRRGNPPNTELRRHYDDSHLPLQVNLLSG